jgi:putative membrane protein
VIKLLLSITVTAALYCGSVPTVFAQTAQNETFLDKAIEANATEIELGKMAETKAEDPQVKAFAAMMVKDHTKALKQLQRDQDTAQSGTTMLSPEHRELRDRLSQLSGAEFDTAYMNAMVELHEKDIKAFESEAQSGDSSTGSREKPEPAMEARDKAVAQELLPMLKMHVQQAMELQKNMQK